MSIAIFYCLANILLFTLLFIYSTNYIRGKAIKNIDLLNRNIKSLEKIYKSRSYQDNLHF